METAVTTFLPNPHFFMSPSIAFRPAHSLLLLRLAPAPFRLFASAPAPAASTTTSEPEILTIPAEPSTSKNPRSNGTTRSSAKGKKVGIDAQQLKLNWLESLSCPRSDNGGIRDHSGAGNADSRWVVGIDPDISGALAVLKPDNSAQVYDSPHLPVLVGKRVRKRLDVKSIVQLLQKVDAPTGTTVYIEQSIPYPQDGKQGWWSGGFGYGLWIGILVASGYSVVPVPSSLWKCRFKLTGDRSSKDDSRELATTLFPSMSSLLKRKKDHGRAEALLIAAHGKGLKVDIDSDSSTSISEDLVP